MNPLFHTDFSISDSLKSVRKSVLIYETIIENRFGNDLPNETILFFDADRIYDVTDSWLDA